MSSAGGKATKRTRLGKITASIARGTLRSAQFAIASGFKYHVIDAEWEMNYLLDDEVVERREKLSKEFSPFVVRVWIPWCTPRPFSARFYGARHPHRSTRERGKSNYS